ncbi:MAG: hypothetical protein IJ466_07285 [Clostridia bacterium]|nr:hypothetical protein [Clostridia bacterium]
MSKMYDVIGSYKQGYLLADPQGADVIAISCEPGNGIVARGTVMYLKDGEMYAPASEAEAAGTHFLVVLDEETDTDADAEIAETARAYRAGRLIASRVKLKDGASLTAAVALALRQQGINLDQMVEAVPEESGSDEDENSETA